MALQEGVKTRRQDLRRVLAVLHQAVGEVDKPRYGIRKIGKDTVNGGDDQRRMRIAQHFAAAAVRACRGRRTVRGCAVGAIARTAIPVAVGAGIGRSRRRVRKPLKQRGDQDRACGLRDWVRDAIGLIAAWGRHAGTAR